jgi:hypothetical protein
MRGRVRQFRTVVKNDFLGLTKHFPTALGKPKIRRMDAQPPKLLDQVRIAIRTRHYSIRTEQELPGHNDVRTTMIYTHVLSLRYLSTSSHTKNRQIPPKEHFCRANF